MSIETYTLVMLRLYMGLFFLLLLTGAAQIWNIVRKKKAKIPGGVLSCTFLWLISAIVGTTAAASAYRDPSNPNYARYENWGLQDYILHDVKTFLFWLVIGVSLFALGNALAKKPIKAVCIVLMGFLGLCLEAVLLSPFLLALGTIMRRYGG